jgi:hypothetical protein
MESPIGNPSIVTLIHVTVLQHVDLLLGNDRETNDETTSAARQQILNKQIYAAITE